MAVLLKRLTEIAVQETLSLASKLLEMSTDFQKVLHL